MSDRYLGEVQIFGFNFAPHGWAMCNGALLALRQNTALFSLIGINYGGDGRTTFQLPNLVNRTPISQGTGPGLSQRQMGEPVGTNSISLVTNEIPPHNHTLSAFTGGTGQTATPVSGVGFGPIGRGSLYSAAGTAPDTPLSPLALTPAGSGLPHENRQPFLALTYCIALEGDFPSFN